MRFFNKGLYLVDNDLREEPIARVINLAQQNQSEIVMLDIFPEPRIDSSAAALLGGKQQVIDQICKGRQDKILEIVRRHDGDPKTTVQSRPGRRYLDAIKTVITGGYDMVLKMADNPPWSGQVLASDDLHLLRKCPCPVYLMHPNTSASDGPVIAAIDLNTDDYDEDLAALNERLLEMASAAAAFGETELHVVHAWQSGVAGFVSIWADMPAQAEQAAYDGEHRRRQDALSAAMQTLRKQLDDNTNSVIKPRGRLLNGPPESVIPEQAQKLNASTVVMGTVARTGIPGLIMGNTAEDILHQLRCDVVALKPEGFVCPVKP
ncbi:MAG: universal stress protein [Halieaceae bacterium]|jgi:nucleotide-binding universal stress UspA family protein|nr:universal stress protein [Halieaceae bacterium]